MQTSNFGKLKHIACALVLGMSGIQAASAGIMFTTVQPGTANTTAVRFVPAEGAVLLGTTVTGTVGAQGNQYFVDFTGDELLTVVPGSPPLVRATDGALQQLEIDVRNGAFTSLYLNLRAPSGGDASSRYADIMVTAYGGETDTFQLNFRPGVNGNNVFRVDATGDTLLRSVSISTMHAISEVRQARIGGQQAAPVPEPATMLSLGAGMVGLLAARRRKPLSARAA